MPLDKSLGVEDFLNSPITDLLAIVVLFICVCRIFLHDRETGIISLLYSTPNGRKKLILNKIMASFICGIALVFIFYLEVFFIEGIFYGFGDISRPIQSVFGYYTCNLKFSVGEYMILYILMKILAYFVFVIIFSFICTIAKNNIIVYGASSGICVLFYIFYSNISVLSPLSLLHYWNPVQLLQLKDVIGTYTNVNFLGYPVSLKLSSVVIAIFFILLVMIVNCHIFNRIRNLQYKNISLNNKIHSNTKIHSVFYYTCKRSLIIQKGIFIIFLSIIISLGFSQTIKQFYDNDEIYYKNFCMEYSGEIDESTKQFISDKILLYKDTEQKIEIIENSANPSHFKLGELYAKLNDRQAFEKFKNRIDNIPENATIFYDTGYKRYFGLDENNDNTILSLIIAVSLVFILSAIPAQDNKTNMTKILFATKSGKKGYMKNILCFSAVISTLISLIVSIPYIFHILLKYGKNGISDPINGMVAFSDFPMFITVGSAMIFMILLRIILSIFSGTVITLISSKSKGATSAYCINSVIFILPVIILLIVK